MTNEKKNDGGPAHMSAEQNPFGHYHFTNGNLSVRDHFAGLAPPQEINTILVHQGLHNEVGASWIDVVTRARYVWADQMLKAREQ